MSYSTEKLTTVALCDEALGLANARKKRLQVELGVLQLQQDDQKSALSAASSKLILVTAELGGATTALTGMEAGPNKVKMQDKARRLNDQKENLEERLRYSGPAALLDSQLDAGLVVAQVTETDAYIASITAHKATL